VKKRGYTVRIEQARVSVEHRASFRPRTTVLLVIAYLCYCLLPAVRKVLADFYFHRDPVVGGFALVMLLIPFLFGATWLFFVSGEVMHCDAQELRFARRRSLGRWHRFQFPSVDVKELQKAIRGGSKTRHYTVLTFRYGGKKYDMLENLDTADSDRVLKACKAMGLDAIIVLDVGAAMLHDIDKRGWFINPLRSDRDGTTSTKP
jgi:hypothetical protein